MFKLKNLIDSDYIYKWIIVFHTELLPNHTKISWQNLEKVNSFHASGLFLYPPPWKHQETKGFWIFSGRIEKYQWHEMGYKKTIQL